MRKKPEPRFVIVDRGLDRPKTCLPVDLKTHDLIEVSTIGSAWARFIDSATGKEHDCAEYYRVAALETGTE